MLRMITSAALLVLVSSAAVQAAVFRVAGSMTSYTQVVGAADPYGLGLPESFDLFLNTSGNSIVNGTLTFTGNSAKQFAVTGGTITANATSTDFVGIQLPTTGGGIGGVVNLSFPSVIPDTTQASLNTLVGSTGASSLFGFPFTNGSQGFYQGGITGLVAPEPATIGALALALPLARRRR